MGTVDLPNVKFQKLQDIATQTKICEDFYIGAVNVLNENYLPKWSGEKDVDIKLEQHQHFL